MTELSLQTPEIGQPSKTQDPKTANDINAIRAWANGNIDASNLSAATAQSAGLNRGEVKTKGVSSIATEQTKEGSAYGVLETPDQVLVNVTANGLLIVDFQATWKESVSGAGRAAIFVGGNQLKIAAGTATTTAACTDLGSANVFQSLATFSGGLVSNSNGFNYTGDVATGQAIGLTGGRIDLGGTPFALEGIVQGGSCKIFGLAPGDYLVSVRFKASSGSVTAKNRKLWVEAKAFS